MNAIKTVIVSILLALTAMPAAAVVLGAPSTAGCGSEREGGAIVLSGGDCVPAALWLGLVANTVKTKTQERAAWVERPEGSVALVELGPGRSVRMVKAGGPLLSMNVASGNEESGALVMLRFNAFGQASHVTVVRRRAISYEFGSLEEAFMVLAEAAEAAN